MLKEAFVNFDVILSIKGLEISIKIFTLKKCLPKLEYLILKLAKYAKKNNKFYDLSLKYSTS